MAQHCPRLHSMVKGKNKLFGQNDGHIFGWPNEIREQRRHNGSSHLHFNKNVFGEQQTTHIHAQIERTGACLGAPPGLAKQLTREPKLGASQNGMVLAKPATCRRTAAFLHSKSCPPELLTQSRRHCCPSSSCRCPGCPGCLGCTSTSLRAIDKQGLLHHM